MAGCEEGVLSAIALNTVRYPDRLAEDAFYPIAYRVMYYSRSMETRLLDLFHKGYVKGTVTSSVGSEATAVGMALPLRPGKDPVSLLHRDFPSHLLLGAPPYQLVCQYMANAESPTHGREGNAHHGDAAARRFPMVSHLGKMPAVVVGATWEARRQGEDVFGLAVVGDGGSSTGEIHEALNMASVRKAPVLFLIENNLYSFSTPASAQYHCRQLSDRAKGYGIQGRTIDGLDAWGVYCAVCDALDGMHEDSLPQILECMTLRLHGHAAYDKGEYVSEEQMRQMWLRDPLPRTRRKLLEYCPEEEIVCIEREIDEDIRGIVAKALEAGRPHPDQQPWTAYAKTSPPRVKPCQAQRVKNGDAIKRALDYILANHPRSFLFGLDIGVYGSAFKTCKGLFDRYGADRVIDMPLAESAMLGMALGASQVGGQPIMEFQFADFSTEVVTQLGLNSATWFYRSGQPAPILLRLPCGGGLTLGAFHSGEFEGLWSRFPGLKLLYPSTAQECYEAILAGFYDPNPCLVFEHKLLLWSKSGDIDFDGDVANVWRPRQYTTGTDLTLVAFGAMVHEAIAAANRSQGMVEVWNPFVLQPLCIDPIVESVKRTGRLLVVQECNEVQGLGDRIISLVTRKAYGKLKCAPRLLAAPEVPVPFAPELEAHYRIDGDKIMTSIMEMLGEE
jgi:2-oxoisovalerate dehydrogenase E1 component